VKRLHDICKSGMGFFVWLAFQHTQVSEMGLLTFQHRTSL